MCKTSKLRNIIFFSLIIIIFITCYISSTIDIVGKYYKKTIILYFLCGLFCVLSICFMSKQWSKLKTILIILAISIISRYLMFNFPISDDANRYIWEGKIISNNIDPFLYPPNSKKLIKFRDNVIWKNINHKDRTACYPPLIMICFSYIANLSYKLSSIKIFIIIFDILSILVLFFIFEHKKLCYRWILFYSLNPVILFSFSGEAHLDSVMIFFLLLSILFYYKKSWKLMFLALSLSFQSKYVSILIIPFLIKKENIKYLWIFITFSILPFFYFNDLNFFSSLWKFGFHMSSSTAIHFFIREFTNIETASIICAIMFIFIYFIILINYFKKNSSNLISSIILLFSSLLILSSTFHLWYLSWLIPFICIYPSIVWIYFSILSCLYYTVVGNYYYNNNWKMPIWALILLWIPIIILWIRELYIKLKVNKYVNNIRKTVSIIIPVKNEEKLILNCINSVKNSKYVKEIIVIDSNSTDKTIDIAKNNNAKIIYANNGRGNQIAKGIKYSKEDIIIVLHADTIINKNIIKKIVDIMGNNEIIGGAVGAKFSKKNMSLSIIELLNDIRAGIFKVSFGDQVQFFNRNSAIQNIIVPEIPIMEDIETSLNIINYGETVFLWENAIVSERKWKNNKKNRAFMILKNFFTYIIKRYFFKIDHTKIYKEYYKK